MVPNDDELLSRLAHHPDLMEELYVRWGPRWAQLIRATGVPAHDVADVVQHILLDVWRGASRFDPRRGSASGWLWQVARRKAMDYWRQRRPATISWEEFDSPVEDDGGGDHDWLQDALGQLSDRERQVLQLAYYYGFTQKEIAALWGVPLGTVKSLASRAIHKLRRQTTRVGPGGVS
ncbi:MAG: sigma-70 family RNA polymerase sigma factor [Sulfobacillus sp.]|nr:sigma-70 family RNA polymerase sigma factor [Sulfobacillus sp.]